MSLTEEDKQWLTERFEKHDNSDRLAHAEHVLAAHMELSRKDREEYLAWKRDHQAEVAAIWQRMKERDEEFDQRVKESRNDFDERMKESQKRFDARMESLDERIGKLVSGIGELIQTMRAATK